MTTIVDLQDPDAFLDGPPHEALAELRRTSPVYWQDMPDEPGFWAVLTHADVVHVSRNPNLFSAEAGGELVGAVRRQRVHDAAVVDVAVAGDEVLHRLRALMDRVLVERHRHGSSSPLLPTADRRA